MAKYVVIRDDGGSSKICSPHIAIDTLEDARAVLRVFQLEYPLLAKSGNPRIMELITTPLKEQLVESLRIEEVPSA